MKPKKNAGKVAISRRNFFPFIGVGAATLMVGQADAEPASAKVEYKLDSIKIRDIQVASIQDEYVCHLVKITTDAGVVWLG
jgi:hypothetical protein